VRTYLEFVGLVFVFAFVGLVFVFAFVGLVFAFVELVFAFVGLCFGEFKFVEFEFTSKFKSRFVF
jgi:hypothetical protein